MQRRDLTDAGLFLFILFLLLSYGSRVEAQIYKWVDKSGVIHFGQAPPQGAGGAAKLESTLPMKSPAPDVGRSQVEPE